jgi:mercuric ion binding protein
MKKVIITLMLSIGFFGASQMCGCGSCSASVYGAVKKSVIETKVLRLKLSGVTCAGCASHLYNTLKGLEGVLDQSVEYPGDVAIVKYDASRITPDKIIKAIEKAGYKAEVQKEK